MPVPVPYITKQVAHPVIKNHHRGGARTGPFEDLTSTLPELPSRPPPSLGTREEWLKSLPSWRREKPRRIWEEDIRPNKGFTQGYAVAGHAAVNQGTCAEAHLPSLRNVVNGADSWDIGDDVSSDYAGKGPEPPKIRPPWGTRRAEVDRRSVSMDFQWRANLGSNRLSLGLSCAADAPSYGHSYERGTFTPVSEHDSPGFNSGPDGDCSPMEPEPMTPFGAFVDRVVGAAAACGDYANPPFGSEVSHQQDDYAAPIYPSIGEPSRESPLAPALEPPVTPTASAGYKRLTEPLSGWIVNYVWRACTTGFSLAPIFARSCKTATQYPESPPQRLAPAVHSLLLSTLLQPSAILLGMWYIIRLPIYFNAAALGVEYSKEMEFRSALFSEDYAGFDPDKLEESAPFRLIVLGFMLANKWLDDHTFSNKTWHTISKISLPSLNTLESLALEIFCYDLNVPSRDWSQWLEHVLSYHVSLSSPSCLQPISRPSSNPHSLIRKALEEIAQAPAACTGSANQPVFIGLEERRREQSEMEQRMHEAIEIDLDEDGPLRQEYLPKRRFGIMGPTVAGLSRDVDQRTGAFGKCSGEWGNAKPLPPPAKWSPAADEPILRESNRISGHYVAVRAPGHPYAFQGPYDSAYNQNWNPACHLMASKQHGYMYDLPPIHLPPIPVFNGFNYVPHLHVYHARSQSLVYDNRPYVEGDLGNGSVGQPLLANDPAMANHADSRWMDGGLHSYPPPAFVPLPGIGFQSAWLSA